MNETHYSSFFTPGQRITLILQVPERQPFHEWAHVLSLAADLLEVQLSRDTLPVGIQTAPGSTVEARIGSRGNGYRCRGIIVSKGSFTHLSLRLTGDVILDELREYFRIDVYLPLRLSFPEHTDEKRVKEEWLRRRAASIAKSTTDFPFIDMSDAVDDTPSGSYLPPPQAANISGGGVRLVTSRPMALDELVLLEVYLPLHPPMVLDVVGQVITASEQQVGNELMYSTALRYYYIDERDRDRIIQYITTEQLAQLRSYRKKLPSIADEKNNATKAKKNAIRLITFSLCCLLLIWLYGWSSSYLRQHPKSEIHRLFEEGLRRHMDKFR